MQSTVVFLGPSLPQKIARAILVADFRPPIRKGDIYGLLATEVGRIVVIDGIFHTSPSVWQREILAALDQGIEVIGASSMGALRAAELHTLGMKGFGEIFEWYRDGVLDGDDEVALYHAPMEYDYVAFSEPLVNIRYTLMRAAREGKLTREERESLIGHMKATFYPNRSYKALIECPLVESWTPERRSDFQSYISSSSINLKAQDARGVLEYCAQTPIVSKRGQSIPRDIWSPEFRSHSLRFRYVSCDGEMVSWTDLKERLGREPGRLAIARNRVITRWFLVDWGRIRGLCCPRAYVESFSSQWTRSNDAVDVETWAKRRGLTVRECTEMLVELAYVSWLTESGPCVLGLNWNAEATARVEERLSRAGVVLASKGSDVAFLSAWARDSGVVCPKAERRRLLASWGLSTTARRDETARDCSLQARPFRRAIAEQVTAAWLIAVGPTNFGYQINLETAILQEVQLSMKVDSQPTT